MKILIIGIDGGTWRILDPLIKEGYMPTLKYLVDNGTRGTLRSTIPPITAPAWTSFMTGVSPGKHGIFEFNNYDGKYGTYFVNNTHIKYKTIWEILSEFNKRIISINVPMTYPPFPVNGSLVTGMLTPGTRKIFTHPPELSDTIREKFPDYRIMTTASIYAIYGLHKFVDELKKTITKRTALAKFLMNAETWDVAMVHFQSSDIIQHFAYHCLDKSHPYYNQNCKDKCAEVYATLDRAIEQIIQEAEKNGEVLKIIMSDHGFRSVYKNVALNALLYKYGFIQVKKSSLSKRAVISIMKLMRKMDFFNLYRWLLNKNTKHKLKIMANRSTIDYSQTRAFSVNGWLYGNIFINLKGREPSGIVDEQHYEEVRNEIKEKLEQEIDPETGKRVFRVFEKESLFGKTDFIEAPDLMIIPEEGYAFSTSSFVKTKKIFRKNRIRADHTGNHEEEGILIMEGNIIDKGEKQEANILDLMPTILWTLGLPIPDYAEGRILKDHFKENFREKRPERKIKLDSRRNITEKTFLEDTLKERLESLGYL